MEIKRRAKLLNCSSDTHRPSSMPTSQPQAHFPAGAYCVATATLVEPRTTPPGSMGRTKMRLLAGLNGIAPVAWPKIANVGVSFALIVTTALEHDRSDAPARGGIGFCSVIVNSCVADPVLAVAVIAPPAPTLSKATTKEASAAWGPRHAGRHRLTQSPRGRRRQGTGSVEEPDSSSVLRPPGDRRGKLVRTFKVEAHLGRRDKRRWDEPDDKALRPAASDVRRGVGRAGQRVGGGVRCLIGESDWQAAGRRDGAGESGGAAGIHYCDKCRCRFSDLNRSARRQHRRNQRGREGAEKPSRPWALMLTGSPATLPSDVGEPFARLIWKAPTVPSPALSS